MQARRLTWGLAAGVLATAYAALAIGSGLDRLSVNHPQLERLVPAPFRAGAARSGAALALAQGNDNAPSLAEQALRAGPVDRRAASLLGSARLLDGDLPGAEAAFRVSAQLGWRDPATQAYWYRAALDAGDHAQAAERLDALLRVNPGYRGAASLLAPLESTPEGRAALATRLAARPGWLASYFLPGDEVDKDAARRRAAVATALPAAGLRLGCKGAAPFVRALLGRNLRRDASRVWAEHCGEQPAAGLEDGDFARLAGDSTNSPFGWQRQSFADLDLAFESAADGTVAVTLRNEASVSRPFLSQPLALPPERYRLTANLSANGTGRIAASLTCADHPQLPTGVVGDIGGEGQLLDVPPCADQLLSLWLRPGTGRVSLANIRLEPVR